MLLTLASAAQAAFTGLCAAFVGAFFLLVLTPRLHSPVRARLHPWAVHHVERGLDWVVAAQRFQAPWLTRLFTQSSHSVSVTFYASFLPVLFWLGLPELGRDLVFLMCLALYVGNAIKDLVCSPRPLGLAYGRQRLQFLAGASSNEEVELNAKEYGLPSSHTLNTLCLNYLLVWYLHDRQLIAPGTAALLYGLVALWVVWIAASRVYLGFHTPIDILAGAVAGLAVLVCFILIEGYLTQWLLAGPAAVAHAALASLVLLRLHPRPMVHTPSFEFSTSFMGAMFGMVVGAAWIAPHTYQPAVQLAQLWGSPAQALSAGRLLWAARRLGAGFVVVACLKEASRAVLLKVLPLLYRFFPLAVRRLWQPPMHNLYPPAADATATVHASQRQEQQEGEKEQQEQQAGEKGQALDDGEYAGPMTRRRRRGGDSASSGDHSSSIGMASAAPVSAAKQPAELAAAASSPAAAAGGRAPDPRLLAALPHNAKGVPWDVDVTSRFFAYAGIGTAACGVVPRLFEELGW